MKYDPELDTMPGPTLLIISLILFLQKNFTKPPVSLEGQLLWREFFYTAAAGIPNFHKMEGNSVCAQVPWDNNTEYLEAWKHVSNTFRSVCTKELDSV